MLLDLHGPFYADSVRREFDLQAREIENSKLSRKATGALLSATMVASPFLGSVPAFADTKTETTDTTKLVKVLNSVETSKDGTDVAKSEKWVDEKTYSTAEKAVSAKTQTEVDSATQAVEQSAKPGTKEVVDTSKETAKDTTKDTASTKDTTTDTFKDTTKDTSKVDTTIDSTASDTKTDKVSKDVAKEDVAKTEVKKEDVQENTQLVDINDGTVDISSLDLGSATSSTNSNTSTKYNVVATDSTEKFISTLANNARAIAQKNDLYASVMIAQGILESGSGTSGLYCQDKNIFGIKGVYVDKDGNRLSSTWSTNEDNGSGSYYSVDAGFRSYNTFAESLEDYAQLLVNNSLYKGALKSNTSSYQDATKWLQGRYATSTTYASKLDAIIEAYDLTQYDSDFTYTTTSNCVNNETVNFDDYLNLESLATSYLGVPYVWGGTTPNGFDCSGLVQYVYKHALNIDLPRVTYNQQTLGTTVDVDVNDLQLGDLLYWGDPSYHVAMYLGGGNFIEAPQPGETVKITSLQENTPTFAKRLINTTSKTKEGVTATSVVDDISLLSTDGSATLATVSDGEAKETRSKLFPAWQKLVEDNTDYNVYYSTYGAHLNYDYKVANDNPIQPGDLSSTTWTNYAKSDEVTYYKYADFEVTSNVSYLNNFGFEVYKTGNFVIVYKNVDMMTDRGGSAVYGYVYEYTDDKTICLSKSSFSYWAEDKVADFDKSTILKDAYGYTEAK